MHSSRALLLGLVLVASALAGCASRGDSVETEGQILPPTLPSADGGGATPTQPSGAHFVIDGLVVLSSDGKARPLYEDDEGALVRYTVRQPAEAAATESAFVTYLFNGRILDVQQLKLAPGEERAFERIVGDLRENRTFKVEVRAASAVAKAEASVLAWPRAGEGELALGPMGIRIPYGLMEQDGRVVVNLSLDHRGPEQPFRDFRAKSLCLSEDGEVQPTESVRIDAPTLGNATGVDVFLRNCPFGFYGLEFKANGGDAEIVGRLLLVPEGWRPPQA